MHAIIPPLRRESPADPLDATAVRQPNFECIEQSNALRLAIYVPGVEARGVEITTRGPDLMVLARKTHLLRTNWRALHLESAQRDYTLKLRLGRGLDFDALQADLRDGVLTIVIPKRQTRVIRVAARRVA